MTGKFLQACPNCNIYRASVYWLVPSGYHFACGNCQHIGPVGATPDKAFHAWNKAALQAAALVFINAFPSTNDEEQE